MAFANCIANVRECLKAVRTREEALAGVRRNKKSLMSKADYANKRLGKMSPVDENFQQQTAILMSLREQIRTLDVEITVEEASLGDWKRTKAREWMRVLFKGMVECSASGVVIGAYGKTVIENVPTDVTQPGFARARYSRHSHVQSLVADAVLQLHEIPTLGEDFTVTFKTKPVSASKVSDGTSQPPNTA